MSLFAYHNNKLMADMVAVDDIIAAVGTPFYLYAENDFLHAYQAYVDAIAPLNGHVFYAMKANNNQAVLTSLAKAGAGVDTVSAGEIARALAAGFSPSKIIFSGVGKTDEELAYALDQSIYQINIETPGEMVRLNEIACRQGLIAKATFRVNLDVGAGGHAKITTGKSENKFGIDAEAIAPLTAEASKLSGLSIKGLASHIGSQISSLEPFRQSGERMKALFLDLNQQGYNLDRLDLGGGLGVPYPGTQTLASPRDLGILYTSLFSNLGAHIALEPGRSIVAQSGVLITKVIEKQYRQHKTFIIVDAAMNDLIRPTLYEAHHDIIPVRPREAQNIKVDVVGPVCETGDFLAEGIMMAEPERGDKLAVTMAGAYGAVMSSNYNSRPLIAEVMVKGHDFAVVRPTPPMENPIHADKLPPWLA